MTLRLSALLSTLLLSVLFTVAAADNVIRPIRGTITDFSANQLALTTRQGEKLRVEVTDKTRINGVSKGALADIQAGSFIGTAAVSQRDGTLKALEVHVFAPSLRGSGEGFNPFQSANGDINTMTNGTVGELMSRNGHAMTVKYENAQKIVQVPDNVPVVLIVPGDKSLLTPGTQVVLSGTQSGKGRVVARTISAGREGLTPPM